MSAAWLVLLGLFPTVPAITNGGEGRELPLPPAVVTEDPVPRLDDAAQQLRYAARIRLSLSAVRGPERAARRARAVRAYRAVPRHHPKEREAVAEAWFRIGELERAGRASRRALEAFRQARDSGARTDFVPRAALEIGHLHRRAKAYGKALDTYERVLAERDYDARYRELATFWTGRVFLELKRTEDARRVFRRLADSSEDPLMRIRGYDELVLLEIETGDLEWAAGILEQCRKSVERRSLEQTEVGRRVRDALSRMRCRKRLKRAVRERAKQREESANQVRHGP